MARKLLNHVLTITLPLVLPTIGATEAQHSLHGGNFEGTFAFDRQVGYDHGQADDNGRDSAYYSNNYGSKPRIRGKRSDPGDIDYFDAYYDGYLVNRSPPADSNLVLEEARQSHRGLSPDRYWNRQSFIPLKYDDFDEYQRFKYELGSQP